MLGITLGQTRVYQEAKAEGREEGERSLMLRQLVRQVGELPESMRSLIATLPLTQLESLGVALLDFSALADLDQWLRENG